VPAERDRHPLLGAHARDDGERAIGHSRLDREVVRERERGQERRGPVIELSAHHRRCALVRAGDPPQRRRAEDAVVGQAILVEAHRRDLGVDLDRAPGGLVAQPVEAIGPRVQERHAERLAALDVVDQPAALVQQLVPVQRQRARDHARPGDERHGQPLR
jgi:hypothetical protein